MAVFLLNLRHVPEDELDGIREVLEAHGIDYYETPPGRWWISGGGIWLNDPAQLPAAQQLLERYHDDRAERARAAKREDRAAGRHETLWRRLRQRPGEMVFYLAIVAGVLYFSIAPFIDFLG